MQHNSSPIKAVFFDLDDTLIDHQHSRRCGLRALQLLYPVLLPFRMEVLELEHERLLLSNFPQTLDGSLSLEQAMTERIRLLFEHFGEALSPAQAEEGMIEYRDAYDRHRRAVPGVEEVLKTLQGHHIIGVITNGHPNHQAEKIRTYGFDKYVDLLIASEAIGHRKPAPQIFRHALFLAGAQPEEAVMIGDSWHSDVLGARGCGMRALWFNRYEIACPDPRVAPEINSFKPLDSVIAVLNKWDLIGLE